MTFAQNSMHFASHPEADLELENAALWYERRQLGLGDNFVDEFEHTLPQILAEPERYRKIQGDNRQLNFDRFPYAVVYSLQQNSIFGVAVMHLHRRPFYWHHR
jgi:hypothetical protein